MTQEQELQALEKNMAEEKIAIETKYRVIAALGQLPEGYKSPRIYVYSLYGTRGSVKFEHDWFALSWEKFKQPDSELLRTLLVSFPPTGKTMYRDGSLSFRPASVITPEMEEKSKECLDVCPVTVDLELYQHQTASFEWFAELAGELWRMEVEFPLYGSDLGQLDLRWKRTLGETVVDHCQFMPKHGAMAIRWASGGSQYPNKFTLWWDVDTGKETDFPAIAQKAKEPAAV